MPTNQRPAVDPAVLATLQAHTSVLAHELATWARRRVVVTVLDGAGNTTTIDTGGGGAVAPIEIRLNTRFVEGIRNVDTAQRMWTGLALHQLGRVLFPAVDQHAAASAEDGLGPVFRLLDDEQNERLGTALDPKWGQSGRSAVAFMLRSQAVLDELGGQPITAADREPTYAARVRQFGFDLRRHLTGATDEHARRALALVPANLKDLSKDELLALARQVKAILAEGVTFPVAAQPRQQAARPQPGNATTGTTTDNDEVEVGRTPTSWKQKWDNLFRTRRAYILLGASTVFVTSLLLAIFGMGFWSDLFWTITAVLGGIAVAVGVIVFLAKSGIFKALGQALGSIFQRRGTGGGGRSGGFFRRLSGGLRDVLTIIVIGIPVAIWRHMGWLRRIFYGVGDGGSAGYGRLEAFCSRLWYNTRLTTVRLWKMPSTRIVVVSMPVAAIVAMMIAAWYIGLQETPWYVLAIEFAAILGTGALLFWKRKAIFSLLVDDVTAGDAANYELLQDSYVDKRTLEFERISALAQVAVNGGAVGTLDNEVSSAAAALRTQLEEAGFVLREKEEVEDGDDVGDNAADVVVGDLNIMVDDQTVAHAQMHVSVALDCSRSNEQKSGTATAGEKFARGQRFAHMLDRALKGLPGVSSRFFGYTDDVMLDCGTAGDGRVSGLAPTGGGNNDSGALQYIAEDTSRHSDKPLNVLVLISDGLLANCSWGSLNYLAAQLRRHGFIVVPVLVDKLDNPAIEGEQINLLEKSLQDAALQLARIIKEKVTQ